VLDGVERYRERHIRQARLRTLHVIHGHLVFFELEVRHALRQEALHYLMGELVLLPKTRGRYRIEAREKFLVGRVLALGRAGRKIVQLVVIAIVADGGRAFRVTLEVSLVLLLEQCVLCGNPVGDGLRVLGGRGERAGDQ